VFSFPVPPCPTLLFSSTGDGFTKHPGGAEARSNVGTISLVFGIGYLIAARQLDPSQASAAIATPFFLAGLVFALLGHSAPPERRTLEELGTGFALVAAGIIVAILGASSEAARHHLDRRQSRCSWGGRPCSPSRMASDDVDGVGGGAGHGSGVVTILVGKPVS